MRVYLAGPMRGYPEFNFPKFRQVAEELRQQGYEVVSPAEMDEALGFDGTQAPEGFDTTAAILRDLEAIAECQGIVLLPGWEASRGARTEKALADFLGLEVFAWSDKAVGAYPHQEKDTILLEAQRLIFADRNADYGHPRDDFARTAQMWSAILGHEVQTHHVPMMMIALKLSRMVESPGKRDHIVDIAGYAGCIERLGEP